jgi:hypothetical protein
MSNSLRRWATVLLCAIFLTSCAPLLLDRSRVYARVPFQFGTNAAIRINEEVGRAGNYLIYVFLTREPELNRKDWPGEIPVELSLSVSSGKQILVEKRIDTLRRASSDWEKAFYKVDSFLLNGPMSLTVRVTDETKSLHDVSELSLWLARGK